MDQNLVQLQAARVKNVPKFLLGLNQSANIKVNDMEEVDIGCHVKSENFKAMRDKQLEMQHTMSRKGYARLTAELKVKRDVASISRADVWANGHRDKDGKPKNKNVAQKIVKAMAHSLYEEMGKIERNGQNSTNLKEDAVSKVLGAKRNGHMKSQMSDMRNSFDEFKKSQVQNPATTEATPTTPLVSPSGIRIDEKGVIPNWGID
ncbi:hypothetical protein RHSIM_Rhsim02G0039900 [Rhododendron simsii]|uniref:Uncharacterized protein n=1 Tax=Rhododendron simsii TaxID=118357 RepID=A0A834HCW6_RHOSS|nr:hypothetical protein RHSIM_Rhsim02G0039900 [Rhododendron simsii]